MPSLRRFSAHGDFWTRLLHLGARACPWWLEPVFITAYTFLFWLVLGRVRRAIAENLSVLQPACPRWLNHFRAMAVFWNFAWTQAESTRQMLCPQRQLLQWEIFGLDHFKNLAEASRERGTILITAHMGSYDLAARLFANQLHRKIHAVRVPERQTETQAYLEQKRAGLKNDHYHIRYNTEDGMLGLELVRQLANGEWVALQGDRVLSQVSPILVPVAPGVDWRLPRGPLFLALAARSPMLPVFVRRTGWRRYAIEFHAPLNCERAGRDREMAIHQLAAQWASVLGSVLRREWAQWLALETSFVLAPAAAPSSPLQKDAACHALRPQPDQVLAAGVWLPGGWLAGSCSLFIWGSAGAWVWRHGMGAPPFAWASARFWVALAVVFLLGFACIQAAGFVLTVAGNLAKRVWPPADEYAMLTAGGLLWLAWGIREIITAF